MIGVVRQRRGSARGQLPATSGAVAPFADGADAAVAAIRAAYHPKRGKTAPAGIAERCKSS